MPTAEVDRAPAPARSPRPAELLRAACVIVPAYEAERTLDAVLRELHNALPELRASAFFVVDDGSRDRTAEVGRQQGVRVIVHGRNLGKGAALRTGFQAALAAGFETALVVDADGQHPGDSAREVLLASNDARALVLGVRDLARAGAPRANRLSNRISNFFVSRFARRPMRDTQCGLRRYPLRETLALVPRADGYAFEAEVLLRAAAAGVTIVERDIRVIYPPGRERATHFHSVRDPARIIAAVLGTVRELRRRGKPR